MATVKVEGWWQWITGTIASFLLLAILPPANALADTAEIQRQLLKQDKWQGDLDGMVERRVIRALVVYNKMLYFLDGGRQRGASYEALKGFEKFVNKKFGTKTLKVDILFIPVPRDRIVPLLVEGYADIAAANLTITPERKKLVDFSDPIASGVAEILVTGPVAPQVNGLDDLAGKEIHVRESSSYYEHLLRLNRQIEERGKPPVKLVKADPLFEDADLLEMVNAGLIPMVVVDSHKAEFWASVFDKVKLHPDIAVNRDGEIGWAFRKNSPKFKQVVDEFIKGNRQGTLMGNILLKRYFRENKWARHATSEEELKKFDAMIGLFGRYAEEYDFDYLMLVALAYQESQLDHGKRSRAGAVGIMQILPTTATDPNVGIPDIEKLEKNVHAGTKYLRFLRDRYFKDEKIDDINQTLFSFAAYNAGPARVAQLRKEAAERGLDPNVWFHNVEVIAARRVGRETVQYVSNIYKYYVAYGLVTANRDATQMQRETVMPGAK
ncbi:MAG: lytic transglycosylase F [Phycisphaerae bacterium]|nr:lytic transglycosylase F [Phycisphaerae bacterium]